MPLRGEKKPLYRRVNTRTYGVRHGTSKDAKATKDSKYRDSGLPQTGSMHSGKRHGLDYTPLFKFLLKKVGQPWDDVFSEAVSRLDKQEPIFYMVARSDLEEKRFFRSGKSSYFSGLYVDEDGLLQKVDPALIAEDMVPYCHCCNHTFNGEPFGKAYLEGEPIFE